MALKKRILLVLPHTEYRDEEYDRITEFFTTRKFLLDVAATDTTKPATGMFGGDVTASLALAQADPGGYDAVIFIGGHGARTLWEDKHALRIAKEAVKEKKLLAALDFAPVTLANAGVLEQRRATVFPSEQSKLLMKKARYTGRMVEEEADILTTSFPTAVGQLTARLMELLELRGAAISAASAEGEAEGGDSGYTYDSTRSSDGVYEL